MTIAFAADMALNDKHKVNNSVQPSGVLLITAPALLRAETKRAADVMCPCGSGLIRRRVPVCPRLVEFELQVWTSSHG